MCISVCDGEHGLGLPEHQQAVLILYVLHHSPDNPIKVYDEPVYGYNKIGSSEMKRKNVSEINPVNVAVAAHV